MENPKLKNTEKSVRQVKMSLQQAGQATSKINRLLNSVPVGVPMTSACLASQGGSPQLAYRYKLSGWLEPVGKSAWQRVGASVSMEGAVFALHRNSFQ